MKNKKEKFQVGNPPSTCSAIIPLEPEPIIPFQMQPPLLRAYADANQLVGFNYIKPLGPSICAWFQAGNIVNANYSTSLVNVGKYADHYNGLMFFQVDIVLIGLPTININTSIVGNGTFVLVGYGKQTYYTDMSLNYQSLQYGTIAVKKSPLTNDMISLFCVQHYAGPSYWPTDDKGSNDCYTYDVNVQFSYNI